MNKLEVIATTKVNPFPVWLQLLEMDENLHREQEADGLAFREGSNLAIAIWPKLGKRAAVPILAHEISHVLEMLEDIIEDELRGEVRAYTTGWLMEWAWEAYCAGRK